MRYIFLNRVIQYLSLLIIVIPVCFAEDQPASIDDVFINVQQEVKNDTGMTIRDKTHLVPKEDVPGKGDTVNKDEVINQLILRIEALEALTKNTDIGGKSVEDVSAKQRVEQERVENLSLIESTFKRTLVGEGGLLLQPGAFNYVPTFSYTHSSSDRIVIDGFTIEEILVVGDIVSRQVRRDLELMTNTFRLGLKNDFQIDLQVPVGRERLQSYSSSGNETKEDTTGLGDVSLSISHQLIKSHISWPDTLVNLSWKSTSGEDPFSLAGDEELALGSGFESWGLSFTTVSVSDPVVFFSGLSWTKNVGAMKEIGRVNTGDSLGLQMGMVFALNLNSSLSFGFQLNAISKTEVNYQKIPGSNLLTSLFTVGVSRILSNQLSMDVQIAVGLSKDSPDVQLSLSFPYSSL